VESQALFCDMRLFERLEARLHKLPERPFWPKPASLDFTTNDYLALQADGIIRQILRSLPPELWQGGGASRYLGGDHPAYHELEHLLQEKYGQPALLFSSGFIANLTIWEALTERGDTIVYDREIHASIRHGLRLSWARSWGFPHNDWEAAEKLLRQARGETFLVVESLYSMRGDMPDPNALRYLQSRYGCHLFIDEAHTTLLYPNQKTWSSYHGLEPLITLLTFGKAVGLMGAAILAPPSVHAYLQRRCIGTIYSTAMPPLIAAAVKEVFAHDAQWAPRQHQLWQTVTLLKERLTAEGIPFQGLHGPIAMVKTPAVGIPLKQLLPPTVPEPLYRLSLHANHTKEAIENLVQALKAGLAERNSDHPQ
jgi:8-amino-7-oxononanoate synthase